MVIPQPRTIERADCHAEWQRLQQRGHFVRIGCAAGCVIAITAVLCAIILTLPPEVFHAQ